MRIGEEGENGRGGEMDVEEGGEGRNERGKGKEEGEKERGM